MYFKKLEIIGFKSFAEKTNLRFEEGITAIVGPNGCGKSNIFDSIRWALGEQSIKSLRGSKMEDVIFNGTEMIPALGFAEVSITLSNETHILPIDYEEVTVTRRLYRSGESEYLLNNNPVRLKDINELFMGTGIGAESYSLIEQGKIDLVLSSKPEDRRLVFDEATGVSKYKAKKKEALRKLEETDNNLLRINDILVEVKRQIGSIERQASKARRYKEIFDKLKDLEIKLSLNEINNLRSHCQILESEKTDLEQEINQLIEVLGGISRDIDNNEHNIESLNHEILTLNNELIHSQNSIERATQHIKMNAEREVDLNNRIRNIDSQRNNLTSRIKINQENLDKVNLSLSKITQEAQEKQGLMKSKEQKIKEIELQVKNAQERIKEANNKTFEIVSLKTKLNNELIDISSSLNNLGARKRRLDTELIKTKQEKETLQGEFQNFNTQVNELRANYQNTKSESDSLSRIFNSRENEIKLIQDQLTKLNETKIRLESQKEFLQELKLQYEDMPSAKDAELIIRNFDSVAKEDISGIIAKAKSVSFDKDSKTCRIVCEAKLFSLDIKNIEEKIEQINSQIAEKNNLLETKTQEANKLKDNLRIILDKMQRQQIELADKEAILKNSQTNFERISEELSLLEFEKSDVEENIKKLSEREILVKKESEELVKKNETQEAVINNSQSEILTNTGLRESLLLETTEIRTELNAVKTKESDLASSSAMLERTLEEDKETLTAQESEKEDSSNKIVDLNQESEKLESDIENIKVKISGQQINLQNKTEDLSQKENLLDELRKKRNSQDSKVNEKKDVLHKHHLNIQENSFKVNQIKERMLQLYQFNFEEANQIDIQIGIDLEITKQEVEELRKKVESFGTVNLVAIEELEELKERYNFLERQQIDLNTAKETLTEAIRKINRTTRKMFLDTFQTVAKEFKNYFRLLFGGGDAELFLLDEENVLESGIEIICRPPGKKLQNILLLSGGEKSLSAIALIFAIFKTKPAPFCVLDEIDAALDESNVDRYSRMLKDFADVSQFIVITHNKKTIVHADVMYGITMEKSGISKIVSVKLKDNKKQSEEKQNKKEFSPAETN
ncbi:MAG: AAA family ATPase [Candidatus Omnitrophota bacterium]